MMETIQISDPSIAEEVRKQMAEVTSEEKGLMGLSGFLSGSNVVEDANTTKRSGTYMTIPSSLNMEMKVWGTLIVFSSNYTVQIHISASTLNPEIYIRISILESWSVWKPLTPT